LPSQSADDFCIHSDDDLFFDSDTNPPDTAAAAIMLSQSGSSNRWVEEPVKKSKMKSLLMRRFKKRRKLDCPVCDAYVTYPTRHLIAVHGMSRKNAKAAALDIPGYRQRQKSSSILEKISRIRCPLEGCDVSVIRLRDHLRREHYLKTDEIRILTAAEKLKRASRTNPARRENAQSSIPDNDDLPHSSQTARRRLEPFLLTRRLTSPMQLETSESDSELSDVSIEAPPNPSTKRKTQPLQYSSESADELPSVSNKVRFLIKLYLIFR